MQQSKKVRYIIVLFLLGVSVVALVGWNICVGTVRIPLADIFASIRGEKIENSRILWDIRMPRTLVAMILGGALALAGYLLQTFFHNPIAGPFVLGISSGAKMVVALVMVFLMGQAVKITSWALIAAAFVGAMISMGFVLLMSRRVHNMSMLVVSGVMIGYICSAITELVVTFASDAEIVNLHNWSRGSFSGMTWENVAVMTGVVAVTFFSGVFDGKTIECLSVRGSLCKKFRCGYPVASHSHGSVIEHSIRLYRSFCRTNLLCRNCSTAFSKEPFRYGKTNLDDTCLFFRGQCILSVL